MSANEKRIISLYLEHDEGDFELMKGDFSKSSRDGGEVCLAQVRQSRVTDEIVDHHDDSYDHEHSCQSHDHHLRRKSFHRLFSGLPSSKASPH